jgi:hypothetical protein
MVYKMALELISKFYPLMITILPLLHTVHNCMVDLTWQLIVRLLLPKLGVLSL